MTSIVLPKMLTQNGGSNPGIINIATYASMKAFPYATIYAATKAFIIQFAKCLAAENYSTKNIIVQTVCPIFVSTKMNNFRKISYFTPTPQVFAKSALDMFGVDQLTTGYFPQQLKAFVYDLLPTSLWIKLIEGIFDPRRKRRRKVE
ncbi:unnamed protein product [Schistosoma turkestanicum]|nr:unnamed protein product [Schistosoma turkestanicum]